MSIPSVFDMPGSLMVVKSNVIAIVILSKAVHMIKVFTFLSLVY